MAAKPFRTRARARERERKGKQGAKSTNNFLSTITQAYMHIA